MYIESSQSYRLGMFELQQCSIQHKDNPQHSYRLGMFELQPSKKETTYEPSSVLSLGHV